MLFEGGLYYIHSVVAEVVSCDLMLFEGGLYSNVPTSIMIGGCDLMLFEGGLYFVNILTHSGNRL